MKDKLLDKALDFILETQESDDLICEQMLESENGDWCENNCTKLTKECVIKFLKLK